MAEINWNEAISSAFNFATARETQRTQTAIASAQTQQNQALGAVSYPSQPAPATDVPASGGNNNMLLMAGGAALLLVIVLLVRR